LEISADGDGGVARPQTACGRNRLAGVCTNQPGVGSMKYRAKPMLVKAVEVTAGMFGDMRAEAERLSRALDLPSGLVWASGVQGRLLVARQVESPQSGQWIVRLPDRYDPIANREAPTLLVLHGDTFSMLFGPAAEIEPPETAC
jgi:hypothetical protein